MEFNELYALPRHVADSSDCLFYHYMDLPGLGVVGEAWDLRDNVDQYLGNVNFSGKRALDVGAASGFLTFSMEARGADVVSFDLADASQMNMVPYADPRLNVRSMKEQERGSVRKVLNSYWLAHRLLRSSAKVYYGDVYNLPEELGMFDVVVVGMILPHLRDPFLALWSAARRCADTIVVTQQTPAGDQPYALFLPSPEKDPSNFEHCHAWWVLSEKCLVNMLGVLGFEIESCRREKYMCSAKTRGSDCLVDCMTLVARRRAA